MHAIEELLTPREAADTLRVSIATVRRMIDRGDLHAVRLGDRPGATIRVRVAELDRLLSAHDSLGTAVVTPKKGI